MGKYENLTKLKELLDAGVLSQEEFDAEKKKILDATEAPPKLKKKPGFFSAEAIRQREQEFDNLPQAEKIHRWGAAGAILVVFLIFFAVSLFVMIIKLQKDNEDEEVRSVSDRILHGLDVMRECSREV